MLIHKSRKDYHYGYHTPTSITLVHIDPLYWYTKVVNLLYNKTKHLVHLSISTVLQNCFIPATNSSLVCGLISRRICSFSSCHIFSIGLISGNSLVSSTDLFPSLYKKTGQTGRYAWSYYLALIYGPSILFCYKWNKGGF